MEHALRAGTCLCAGRDRCDRFVRIVLHRGSILPPGSIRSPDIDISEAVGGRPPDHFPDARQTPLLVPPVTGADLLGAVFGTQTVATLIAVYGVLMTPIGWGWALLVWGYALAWFLVNDQVTVVASKILDRLSLKRSSKMTATVESA